MDISIVETEEILTYQGWRNEMCDEDVGLWWRRSWEIVSKENKYCNKVIGIQKNEYSTTY